MTQFNFTAKQLETLLSEAKLDEIRAIEKQRVISIYLAELIDNNAGITTTGI